MTPTRRNIYVGFFVLGSLVMLGWMVLKFGGQVAAPFAPSQIPIQIIADRSDGLFEGSAIYYRGVMVGHVSTVTRDPDQISVIIDATVDQKPPLPANLSGIIKALSLIGGGTSINLETTELEPRGRLKAGDKIHARFTGNDLFPREFADLARDLRETSRQIRETNLPKHLSETIMAVQKQVAKLGEVLESVQTFVDDPRLRQNLQDSIKNFRTLTETANRAGDNLEKFSGNLNTLADETTKTVQQTRATIVKTDGHIDTLAKQMSFSLQNIAGTMEDLHSITQKIDKGQGTAGAIVNDPRLYQGLTDSAKELKGAIEDLRRLVQQWEQEGLVMKMK